MASEADELLAAADAAAAEEKAEEPDRVSVSWGEETFCPVAYQSFRFGNFFMSTKVRPGEAPEDAMERAWTHLNNFALKTFQQKRDGFISRLRESGDTR